MERTKKSGWILLSTLPLDKISLMSLFIGKLRISYFIIIWLSNRDKDLIPDVDPLTCELLSLPNLWGISVLQGIREGAASEDC